MVFPRLLEAELHVGLRAGNARVTHLVSSPGGTKTNPECLYRRQPGDNRGNGDLPGLRGSRSNSDACRLPLGNVVENEWGLPEPLVSVIVS